MLKPLPSARTARIAVGTTIRKPLDVVQLYLKHLDAQSVPDGVRLVPYFALDTDDADVLRTVEEWAAARGGTTFRSESVAKDFSDTGGPTHHWTHSAFYRVGHLKNQLIRMALDDGCEGFWFVDADLLCDPTTFDSLWMLDAPITCAVYWTRWNRQDPMALPQVWLNHPYQLEGRGMDWADFRSNLVGRQVTQVWGQGACTLIRDTVFHKGVDFTPVPGLPEGGMWQGEDRAFCIRAEQAHIPMLADPWPDIFHIYHDADREDAARWSDHLLQQSDSVSAGDWASVLLEPMEPVVAGGMAQRLAPYTWRGRVGHGRLLPEMDTALLTMQRGQSAILGVMMPLDYPSGVLDPRTAGDAHATVAGLRGRKRLIRVTLVDHRPYRQPPNLDRLPTGHDTSVYTDRQLAELVHD